MGKKKQPIYKVVAADERSPRDGRIIEALGLYNPITDPATVDIKEDRVLYWLGVGAIPTATVKNLLSKKGILYKRELLKSGLSEDEVNQKIDEWLKQQEAKLGLKAEKKASLKEKKKESVKEQEEEKSVPEAEGAASEKVSEEEKATEE
jgi:small subunit ribosomal protein S16